MDSINSSMGMGPQMYALKKAIDSQDQGIMKLLDSVAVPQDSNASLAAELTGLGQNLDIKA
ncbi:MAG: hypothetical protein PHU29_00630 [Sulfuricurvum sp.]|nr:hypothetical protein [Sulfuricurvum sp.]